VIYILRLITNYCCSISLRHKKNLNTKDKRIPDISSMKMDDNIYYLLHDSFLLGLFFYPEDGGDMFL
jgi:hypothetical protein